MRQDHPPRTVPGDRTYIGTTKYGKEICFIGDSHIKGLSNYLNDGKVYLNGFSGAKIKRLDHFEETIDINAIRHVRKRLFT